VRIWTLAAAAAALVMAAGLAQAAPRDAVTQADLQALQAQMQALAQRLDALEAANAQLKSENAELQAVASQRDAEVESLKAQSQELGAKATATSSQLAQAKGADWASRIKARGDLRYRHERLTSERDVNEALKAQLAGVANFLDTDHVELRRWLVDAGWLTRDGFGREYQRVAAAALPATLQPLATAFEGVDTDAIAAATRAAHSAGRDDRQRAWRQRKGESS